MRAFQTTVLERKTDIGGGFATEPFEAGWAGEAIYFVELHDPAASTFTARVQVSPDGIRWSDEGTYLAVTGEPGLRFVRVTQFGGWLRLAFDGPKQAEQSACVTIHLVLKE